MGEYADDIIDQIIDAEGPWHYPIHGRFKRKQKRIVCNRCGTRDLHWVETKQGWRLYTTENFEHECNDEVAYRNAHQNRNPK